MKYLIRLLTLSCLIISGCGTPQDYLSQDMLQRLEESMSKNKDKNPLIGTWRTSFAGVEMKVAVDFNTGEGEKLKAVLLNGDEVGFAFYNGHPSFYVSPTAQKNVYTGKMCYQNSFGVEKWFSTKIILKNHSIFRMYDDVPSYYPIYGGHGYTVRDYIRIGRSWKETENDKDISIHADGENEAKEKVEISQGSGILLSESGFVVTNYHVVKGGEKVTVYFPELNQQYYAEVSLKDINNDLAILKLKDFSYDEIFADKIPYTIKDSSSVLLAESVFTLGFPYGEVLGKSAKFSTGTISSQHGLIDNASLFQISNPIQPGNSGGPLFNKNGDLVGVVVASLDAATVFQYTGSIPQNINFAIKSDYLKAIVGQLHGSESILKRKGILNAKSTSEQVELLIPYVVKIHAEYN